MPRLVEFFARVVCTYHNMCSDVLRSCKKHKSVLLNFVKSSPNRLGTICWEDYHIVMCCSLLFVALFVLSSLFHSFLFFFLIRSFTLDKTRLPKDKQEKMLEVDRVSR